LQLPVPLLASSLVNAPDVSGATPASFSPLASFELPEPHAAAIVLTKPSNTAE
jgi:hypothetical protein